MKNLNKKKLILFFQIKPKKISKIKKNLFIIDLKKKNK